MIDTLMKPFDFAMSLTLEQQFRITVAGCSIGFVCAAILRELIANPGVKWAARVLGCGAFFALVCYGQYATTVAVEVRSELMVRKAHDAQEIADQVGVLAVASEYTATTTAGNKISVENFSGQSRPVSSVRGRSGFHISTDRRQTSGSGILGFDLGGSNGRAGSVPTGTPGMSF